jgi:hypothetical protein
MNIRHSRNFFLYCECGSNMAAQAKCLTGAAWDFRKQIRSVTECRLYRSINAVF